MSKPNTLAASLTLYIGLLYTDTGISVNSEIRFLQIPNLMNIIPNMKDEEHPLNLGKLLVNFQSLEFALRAFLVNDEIALGVVSAQDINLAEMNEGDVVPKNAFTNYDTLDKLIGKYNKNSKVISLGLTIDKTLVEVRDAIAHGRVAGPTPAPPFKLLKFDKPRNSQVTVKYSVLLTKEWFSEQHAKTQAAVLKVSEANQRLQTGKL